MLKYKDNGGGGGKESNRWRNVVPKFGRNKLTSVPEELELLSCYF